MDPGLAPGVQTAGISVLQRAVELDKARRFTEALVCYEEGIQLLIDVLKTVTDETKKKHYRQKISDYMDRAEKIKEDVAKEKEAGKYNEQIQIDDNATGYNYATVFGRFIDESLTAVEVQDPYIRSTHQIYNFLRLCELLVKLSRGKVRRIRLITGQDDNGANRHQQAERLTELRHSLSQYNVTLDVTYEKTLHDREVRFNNGWIIKIGRGLDYFKPKQTKFSIGYCDYDLRQCHQTTIDIMHRKHTKSADLCTR